jgi:Na+-transporting NADH:ubiquinone oxidoreductase subunit NqrB
MVTVEGSWTLGFVASALGNFTSMALWLIAELVIIKNINSRKIMSVIEAMLNSAFTLFFLFNSINDKV